MPKKLILIDEIPVHNNGVFSDYTNPEVERIIDDLFNRNAFSLTHESRKLAREFLLYGFLQATDQEFKYPKGATYKPGIPEDKPEGSLTYLLKPEMEVHKGKFSTDSAVLALSDWDGKIYIRGGDNQYGYYIRSGEEPRGVEGTLLSLGYHSRNLFVPHSNGDTFVDPQRERLFEFLSYFSGQVRALRGKPSAEVLRQGFSEPEKPVPYPKRDSNLARIPLYNSFILIPGNRENTIFIYR